MRNFIFNQIKTELERQGLNSSHSERFAMEGVEFYKSKVCNSKDPFKDSCDHAGAIAERYVEGFKYKSPKSKQQRRQKRPQEAFNFNG